MYQLNSLVMEEFTILLKWWHKCKKKGAQNVLNHDITRDGLNGEKILGALSHFCFIIDPMKL